MKWKEYNDNCYPTYEENVLYAVLFGDEWQYSVNALDFGTSPDAYYEMGYKVMWLEIKEPKIKC